MDIALASPSSSRRRRWRMSSTPYDLKRFVDDLRAITGRTTEIPMFTYQTQGPAGEAQLMAADEDPHLYMVGPHCSHRDSINGINTSESAAS